jgi:hypothetical protein
MRPGAEAIEIGKSAEPKSGNAFLKVEIEVDCSIIIM